MAVQIDVRPITDCIELMGRFITAYLGVPSLPDEFWGEFTTTLTPDIAEELTMCLNACAVMVDASQHLAIALPEES